MSSTHPETAPAHPARWRALIALFGVAMFALGVGIGGLGLPRLLALNPPVTPQASVVAQVSLATTTATVGTTKTVATPTVAATTTPPAAMAPSLTATRASTAARPSPTATLSAPTPTLAPTPTVTPTSPPSSIFAPDPEITATTTATTPTAVTGTPTSGPTTGAPATAEATATATVTVEVVPTPPATPTPSPTTPPFAATDRINTEIPVNFRAGPGTAYAAQIALAPGTLLAATGQTATVDGVDWGQFSIANGTIGWVRAQDVLSVR